MPADHDHTLEAEIARLGDLGLDDLRKLWGRLVGEVPTHHGASLLRRRLGYELQARAHGECRLERLSPWSNTTYVKGCPRLGRWSGRASLVSRSVSTWDA